MLHSFFALIQFMLGVIIGQGAAPGAPPPQGLYTTNFNTLLNGNQDPDWCDHGPDYGDPNPEPIDPCVRFLSSANTSAFSGSPSYLTVYELKPSGLLSDDYHVSYIGSGSQSWSGYELRADVRMDAIKSQGLLMHSKMPLSGGHYSFRIYYAQTNWRLTNETNAHPVDTCLDTNIFPSAANIWHHVKMRSTVVAGVSVTIDACIWQDGAGEPAYGAGKMQGTFGCGSCTDAVDKYESGTIGLWTHAVGGASGRYFDNITVNDL